MSKVGNEWWCAVCSKIMARKDRHGLYVGSPQSSLEKEQGKPLDNPVITALEKVRLRPQGSTESAESRASRASAAGSPAGSGAPGGGAAEEAVVGGLDIGQIFLN